MAASALSRRLSEFVGVALFGVAMLWLVSLASYNPADPVWFFNTGADLPPTNFAGRIGAFTAELSLQMFGYAAYLVPIVLVVIGWHYFWCRVLDAAYTKLFGAGLLFACVAAFLSLAFVSVDVSGRPFLAGGYIGRGLASGLSEYLNRTGSIILILTLLFLAIVLVTQFSFGRLFAVLAEFARERIASTVAAMRARREEARRERQRQEVLRKHLEKSGKDADRRAEKEPKVVAAPAQAGAERQAGARAAAAQAPAPRRVRPAAARAARCAEGRAEDRRTRADGWRAPARGEVPRVLGRGRRRPDPSGAGGHDLRAQAGCGRQIQQNHRAGRRPVPRDAGRVGAHRPHSRQVHRRDPDSQPHT